MSVKFNKIDLPEIIDEVAIATLSLAIVLSVPLLLLTSL